MSLNKDDPIIKSFIDGAQQDLQAAFADIETRILQACGTCTSAEECSDKINAIASATNNDFKNLSGKVQSRVNAILENNPNYNPVLLILSDTIVDNDSKTISALKVALVDYAWEIVGTDGDNGAEVFPNNLKIVLDSYFGPFYTNSAIFFGWLELQPTPTFVT